MKVNLEGALPNDDSHAIQVVDFIEKRISIRERALERSDNQKDKAAERHDLGVEI